MNLNKILLEGENHKKVVTSLKEISPIYPEVLNSWAVNIKTTYLSTLVRIQREGKWYLVHCLESFKAAPNYELQLRDVATGYQRLIRMAHNVQHLYMIGANMEDLDPDQRSEDERLREMRHKY